MDKEQERIRERIRSFDQMDNAGHPDWIMNSYESPQPEHPHHHHKFPWKLVGWIIALVMVTIIISVLILEKHGR